MSRARSLHARGVEDNNAGHPMRARRSLRTAIAALAAVRDSGAGEDVGELAARIWISVATAESELQGLQAGLDALAEAERALGEWELPQVRVLVHMQRGYMHVRGGNLQVGMVELDRAVDLIAHADDDQAHSILLNRGTAHLFAGRLRSARGDFERASEIAGRLKRLPDLAMTRHNLGYLEFLAGNLALALRIIDEVIALDADVSRAVILLDQARVLIEAGLHREADDALREAGTLFAADRLSSAVAEVELARAECALLDGEISAARRLAASARDRFRRRRNDRWRRDAELVLLQADLAAGRPGSRLAPPALRLAEEFRAEGLPTRARTAQLVAAEALLAAGRLEQAHHAATEAGPIRASDAMSARLHTRLVRARTQLAGGDRAGAGREIRTGLAELTRHRAQFGSLDLQTASAVHGRQLVELDLRLAVSDGRPAAVLAAAERGRAISARLPAVTAPADELTADLLAELRQATEELRTIESDPLARERAGDQRRRIDELQQSLRSRAWQATGAGQASAVTATPELLVGLDAAGAALICFVESAGRLHAAVLIPGGGSRVVPLAESGAVAEAIRRCRADLDVLANGHVPASLRAAVRASVTRSLTWLDSELIRPLDPGTDQLVIVPTGPLGTVAWGLLPSLRGRPVTVAPSATAWYSAQIADSQPLVGVAVLAGPDLAHAGAEAALIGRQWPGASLFEGGTAGRQQLLSAMRDCSVVHVAAHGQHQAENPLFSSLRLSDGPVFAYEFDGAARAPEHVVLSACELGQATIRPGDEALGLTSVLLHLGSHAVVSGVARVHDEISAQVMGRYHRDLAGGASSARALADAIEAARDLPAPFVNFGASWRVPTALA
ncbi:CHAT domain-containing tetratricopeptide repeat protein [Jatrophihabitans telluris]|uniref:CHAT domain-containing tetratricopeptide repeat protein n=1 Tax=Jatrophihabitans telluris TaxID=2038343 RepID=A0ABY4QY19_9ACTN|nr:CHAT domain-containing tetratricopeptide repeat protein [Jatrophihabitans telluris]UQX88032.1 CHAT domain-containing tetratricopeptide repeat protein [Jatrophihabitans telluris]